MRLLRQGLPPSWEPVFAARTGEVTMDPPLPSPNPESRREFLRRLAAGGAALGFASAGEAAGAEAIEILGNSDFELRLATGAGLHCRIVHRPSGAVLADGPYSYSFASPVLSAHRPDPATLVLSGGDGSGLGIEHRFAAPPGSPWIEEEIVLTNRGTVPLDLAAARCGFLLPLEVEGGKVRGPWSARTFTAVPFRREPDGHVGQYLDFSAESILTTQYSSGLWGGGATDFDSVTSQFAAEGWVLAGGTSGFLISKYSQAGPEWAILDRTVIPGGRPALRWGGFGIYRRNPEHGAWILPGRSHRFGLTRLTAYAGGFEEGCYTFRREMEARGHGCPPGFDPPVHWNELYDNKLFFLPGNEQDDPAMRRKYYTLDDMKAEAAKAKEIGCQALYLDPGWDTNFASKIWDEARLGPYREFTAMLRRDYGLKSSLHTPCCAWCNPTSYPVTAYRVDRYGKRLEWAPTDSFGQSPLCGASRQYVDETARRLKALARDGAAFFMFDGTKYRGECWDPDHGHAVPARMAEHVEATDRLARIVHADYPDVLIEMHDPLGSNRCHFSPIYLGHGPGPVPGRAAPAAGFDSVWAFELMWRPMEDLLSGRAVALYYYNLAYSLPLYIHIDLRTDNEHALVFWWNASTCRHLGIGGTHPDPAVRRAQREAMRTYRELEACYKAGIFYGLGETIHLHRHPTRPAAVVNLFNLGDEPVRREVTIEPAMVGLPPGSPVALAVDLPPRGHHLARIGSPA